MAIKGDFKDINITDIIQLIARDRKTGSLLVKKADNKINIYFIEGKIVFVDNKIKTAIIGQRLVKAGILTKAHLQNIQKEQKKDKKSIYELMVKMGYIDFENAKNFLLNQIAEDIYSVFLWTDGYYQFEAFSNVPYKDFMIEIDPDSLLFDAARVLDEWKVAKQRIVSEDVILEKKELGDKSIDRFSPEEKKIYSLINGNLTVNEIIEHSLLSMFDAYLIINHFLENDIISMQIEKKVGRKFTFDSCLPYIHWEGIFHKIVAAIIFLLLVFFCWNNLSSITRLWDRMTDYTLFLETKSSTSSTMADTFYRLEEGPWPGQTK
ncbi:MAG: DUF4388 domain-containing protein [bacterium]